VKEPLVGKGGMRKNTGWPERNQGSRPARSPRRRLSEPEASPEGKTDGGQVVGMPVKII